jgi:uncharacterized membrane protein YgdD (TMEM256/DUF423 family)
MEIQRKFLVLGSFFGLTAVVLGAFGAHALKEMLNDEAIASFETGVKYQMYHALLLLFLGVETKINLKTKKLLLYFIGMGIVLFSFSIYLLATNAFTAFNFKQIALITPVGGTLLIIAWILMLIHFLKKDRN